MFWIAFLISLLSFVLVVTTNLGPVGLIILTLASFSGWMYFIYGDEK